MEIKNRHSVLSGELIMTKDSSSPTWGRPEEPPTTSRTSKLNYWGRPVTFPTFFLFLESLLVQDRTKCRSTFLGSSWDWRCVRTDPGYNSIKVEDFRSLVWLLLVPLDWTIEKEMVPQKFKVQIYETYEFLKDVQYPIKYYRRMHRGGCFDS